MTPRPRWERTFLNQVGTRIRQARRTRKRSQTDVAVKAGIGRITLLRIEQGAQDPTLTTVARIARALGVGLRDLVPPTGEDRG